MVVDSDEWKDDDELQMLPTLDILLAFEDYSRVREREFEEQMRRRQVEKTRRERKAREVFRVGQSSSLRDENGFSFRTVQELLNELVKSGEIKARTKWKEVYPGFANDPRYLGMLGNPGSNPIELFWDVVDALDQRLDTKIAIAEGAIKRHNQALEDKMKEDSDNAPADGAAGTFEVGPQTIEEEFLSIVKADEDESIKTLADEDLSEIYHSVRMALFLFIIYPLMGIFVVSYTILPSRSKQTRSAERNGSSVTSKTIFAMLSKKYPSFTMPPCPMMR